MVTPGSDSYTVIPPLWQNNNPIATIPLVTYFIYLHLTLTKATIVQVNDLCCSEEKFRSFQDKTSVTNELFSSAETSSEVQIPPKVPFLAVYFRFKYLDKCYLAGFLEVAQMQQMLLSYLAGFLEKC